MCGTPDEDIWVKPREQNQLSEIILGYIQPVVVKTYFWRQYRSAPLPSYGRHRKCRNDEDGLQSLVSRHLPAVCRTAPGCCPAPLPDPAPGQRLLGQRCRRIPPPPRVRTDPAGRGAPLLTPALSALTGQPRRGPGGSPLSRRFPGGGGVGGTNQRLTPSNGANGAAPAAALRVRLAGGQRRSTPAPPHPAPPRPLLLSSPPRPVRAPAARVRAPWRARAAFGRAWRGAGRGRGTDVTSGSVPCERTQP